jgi:TetR/AcrR family transcriptional regulator, transcriptional repressor for nem operon
MRKTREQTKEQTREALIDAGMALFGQHGLDAPSLDAICARAGYTRGAFYVHFKDRDDLIAAVMERVGVAYLDTVLKSGSGDLLGTMQRYVQTVVDGTYPLTQKNGVRPHQLLQACARSPVIRKRYVALVQDTINRVRDVVRGGQAQNLVRDDVDAEQVANVLLAAVIGAQAMLELKLVIDPIKAGATFATVLAKGGSK